MNTVYIYKYHLVWMDDVKRTGEGYVFASDYSIACEELRKMYGPYINKLYLKEVGTPNCYVFETKENGKEVTDRWY